MKRTLPIASQPAALASTLPPTSDNVMTIPSDTFMTVLLFAGLYTKAHYTYEEHALGLSGRSRMRSASAIRLFPVALPPEKSKSIADNAAHQATLRSLPAAAPDSCRIADDPLG